MLKRMLAFLLVLALMAPVFAVAETKGLSKNGSMIVGSSGDGVLAAQQKLKEYGYYTGALDGKFGKTMETAVKQFQSRNGLTVDGKIGTQTLTKLNSGSVVKKGDVIPTVPTLAIGSSGAKVKELQTKLREAYYYAGKIDGIFGTEVSRAVKWFQASAGLTVDGKAGKKTQDALYNRTAKIFNGGIPVRFLSAGDRGYDVFVLQQKLANLNYTVTPTGYFNAETTAAVQKFQKANNLTEDGKVGSTVRRYLWPSAVDTKEKEENDNKGTPEDPYVDRVLQLGSSGSDVANAQMRLKAGGYLRGKADGIFGPTTKAAVIKLQKAYGLKQDGIIGASTWAIIKTLNVASAEPSLVKLQSGSRGAAVTKLQQQLITLGYLAAGGDDGKFGPKTAEAVKAFQKAEGLKEDGVVGTKTFLKLNEKLGNQWDVPVG